MMKRAQIGILATAVLAVATLAFAQAKPDFSGTWAPEADPAMAAPPAGAPPAGAPPAGAPPAGGGGGGRGMGGGPMTVKHTATEISVETAGRGGMQTRVYKLDGSETKITMGQMEGTATAKWDGSKLVITTKAGENEQTQTWSLAAGTLTVERTGGRGPSKTVYKKTT